MFVVLVFLFILPSVISQQEIPMFGVCNNNERCEGSFICKHHICLPPEDPTPIILEYANDASASSPQNQGMQFVPHPPSSPTKNVPNSNAQLSKQHEAESMAKAQAQALADAQQIWQKLLASTAKTTHAPPIITIQQNATPAVKPSQPTAVRTLPTISHVNVQIGHPKTRTLITCKQACVGTSSCVRGSCKCTQPGVLYNPIYGCHYVNARPMMAVPIPPVQRVPQAKPFEACEAVTECTGGSICIKGKCLCPPDLAHQGEVCVARIELSLPAY